MPLNSTTKTTPRTTSRRRPRKGDVVTIDLKLTPENGFVPTPLFDTCGTLSFVLGWGNYLPGLHTLLETRMQEGQSLHGISMDAGWGSRDPNLVIRVQKSKLRSLKNPEALKVGMKLHLSGGIAVEVMEVDADSIVVDGNPPLAGASYSCDVALVKVEPQDGYQVATFALGCFWGGELAYMREPGVVGTKVGYTQGVKPNPTYEEVCSGTTRHREAIFVVYDPLIVTYERLLQVAMERLAATTTTMSLSTLFQDDEVIQYKHGVYHHSEEQRRITERVLKENNNKYGLELLAAAQFHDAEDEHQQYLLKLGQSAKKGAKEPIRCFG